MENEKIKATEDIQAAKATAADKLETFRTEAGQHLNAAASQLDEMKDKLVAQAQEFGRDIDIEGLKVKATEHFEAAKAATAENLANLQAQAETAFAAASAKADELSDVAEDKFDELKAEASVQLAAAQVKLDELKAEAALQIEAAKEKAKSVWNDLFGG
ncbi:hypothetical protein [Spirosoma sp.]|uniref:hypothetical protein n=1 Tax=Spirosoma sp. TaxID=1899569 RepID=UPI003B3A548E